MTGFLDQYLFRGFSEIFVLGQSFREEQGGYNADHFHETVVVRKSDRFFEITVRERVTYFYNAKRNLSIDETEISEADYRTLSAGKERVDTPGAVEAIESWRADDLRREALRIGLEDMAPLCPKCGKRLTQKTGRSGPFWGCPSYPGCNGTRSFSAEAIRLHSELR